MSENLDISKLLQDNRNANKGTQKGRAALRESLKELGTGRSILLDKNNRIIAGNKTTEAAIKEGIKNVRVVETIGDEVIAVRRKDLDLDGDDGRARRLAYADNRIGELGLDWDMDIIKEDLFSIDGLDFLFDQNDKEFRDMFEPDVDRDAEAKVDVADELAQEWGTKEGQVWSLPSQHGGEHRLICGDSTNHKAVAKVLGNDKPGIMVTDPPYGVEYDQEYRSKNANKLGKVLNDDRVDWTDAWRLFWGDVAYVYHAGIYTCDVAKSLEAAGLKIRSQIIWNKPQMVMGRGDYHWKHEPCWYVVRDGKTAKRNDDRTQTTVWDIDHKEDGGHGHSTQKPVECMARPIRNHEFDMVYEPFSGSGTTIIAAENCRVLCRAVELSPGYVAVALQRYLDAFDLQPELIEE